jgi:cytochrome d ubiquinol oxidase subunit II
VAALFFGLFPRVLVSNIHPKYSLTIYNASSSNYTLKTMTIIALVLLPIILVYQTWSYWIFRGKVSSKKLKY